MTDEPLVSVLMTAYNRADYIGAAIESVLASNHRSLELIVVDDGSKDETVEITWSYVARDDRVKVHINAENFGDYPNRNKAASLATGKYLKYVDSDDMIYPHGLSVMVACMERFPEAGYGLSQHAEPGRPHPILLSPADSYRENFFGRDLFGRAPGSAIIRTDAFRAVGGFTGKRQVGDHEFWLMIGRRYPMVTMPRDLVWDRTHGQQEQFFDSATEKAKMHDDLDLAALAHPQCPLSPEERERALAGIRRHHVKTVWRHLLRGLSPKKAFEYRRKLDVAWPSVLSYPFSRRTEDLNV